MRTAAKLFGLLALVGSAACSSSSTSTTPAGPTADEACGKLADTFCTKASGCSPLLMPRYFGDLTTCKDRFKMQCVSNLNAPSTGATPDTVVSCNTSAASITCTDLFHNASPADCKPAGKLADGAACGDDSQCVSKFCNVAEKGAVCGKCSAPPAAGSPCGAGGKCAPTLDCVEKTNKCAKPAASGEACDANIPCLSFSGLTCNDGKCGPAAKSGEACNFNGTGKPSCDLFNGYICIPEGATGDGHCQLIKYANVGDKCGYDKGPPGTFTLCNNAATCKLATAGDSAGTCVAAKKDGEACSDDPLKDATCLSPARCVNEKCVFPDPSTCK